MYNIRDEVLRESERDQPPCIVEKTEQFTQESRKGRNAFKEKADLLSRTQSRKVSTKLVSRKQRNYLQSILKDTETACWVDRK
jgi:hypothetical protein